MKDLFAGNLLEESVMHARSLLVIASVLPTSTAFAAQPAKQPTQAATESRAGSAPVVLASADTIRQPALADQQASNPPKRRVARVTTCRCGDPQPSPDQ